MLTSNVGGKRASFSILIFKKLEAIILSVVNFDFFFLF